MPTFAHGAGVASVSRLAEENNYHMRVFHDKITKNLMADRPFLSIRCWSRGVTGWAVQQHSGDLVLRITMKYDEKVWAWHKTDAPLSFAELTKLPGASPACPTRRAGERVMCASSAQMNTINICPHLRCRCTLVCEHAGQQSCGTEGRCWGWTVTGSRVAD